MKTVLLVYDDLRFDKQIIYAANIIFKDYDVDLKVISRDEFNSLNDSEGRLLIYYGNDMDFQSDITVLKGKLFGEGYLTEASFPEKIDFYNNIPVFFKDDTREFTLKSVNRRIIYNNDILETVFFFLTCYEEYVRNDYDRYGRSSVENCFLYRNKLIDRPVVNENIDYFIKIIFENFGLSFSKKNKWQGREFAAAVTHDVDAVYKYLPLLKEIRLMLSMIFIDKKPRDVVKRIRELIDIKIKKYDKDPFDTFDYMLQAEKRYGYRSSFYFMTADNKCYDIDESRVKNLLGKIEKAGCEIGLHPGFGTAYDEKLLKKQMFRLQDAIGFTGEIGVRQHYLSFYSSNTWRIQEKCDIKYDISVAYPDIAGFKTGYCLPYKPYDLKENRVIDIWEIPLIVMEGSLIDHMKLDFEESKKYISKLMDGVKKSGGVFVLLWHNSSLNSDYCSFGKDLFDWSYEYINMNCCFSGSGMEVLNQYIDETGEFNCKL